MARVEVITGPERRRRWTEEQKQAIVAETMEPGAVVAEVARRAEVGPGQIYRWRQELRGRSDGFAQVMIAAPGKADRQAGDDPGFCAALVIEVDFACDIDHVPAGDLKIRGLPGGSGEGVAATPSGGETPLTVAELCPGAKWTDVQLS